MIESDIKAKLSFSDGTPDIDLPIYKGTVGPDVIDIRKLYGQTGKFTYDSGSYLLHHAIAKLPTSMAIRVSCSIAATQLKI